MYAVRRGVSLFEVIESAQRYYTGVFQESTYAHVAAGAKEMCRDSRGKRGRFSKITLRIILNQDQKFHIVILLSKARV